MYPRSAVPADIGARVRDLRTARGWSQERLARRFGASRRTISRLEADGHVPRPGLVHALERAFGLFQRLVPGWPPDDPYTPLRGPRARRARRAAGLSLLQVSRACGVSVPTLSRFEREYGSTEQIVLDDRVANDRYARAIGFEDAADMDDYCRATDPRPWLERLAPAT